MRADEINYGCKGQQQAVEDQAVPISFTRKLSGRTFEAHEILIGGTALLLACGLGTFFLQRISAGLVFVPFISGAFLVIYTLVENRRNARTDLLRCCGETRRLLARVLNDHDDERRRLSRELHEEIAQELTAVLISINVLALRSRSVTELQRELDLVGALISQVLKNINGVSRRLHPGLIESLGLEGALAVLCREVETNHSIKVNISGCELVDGISVESARCLFTVAKEALDNAMQHSQSKSATIEITNANGFGQVRVKDSGCGFNADDARYRKGFGIIRMQERVSSLNGVMRINSMPKKGTEVVAAVPLVPASGCD